MLISAQSFFLGHCWQTLTHVVLLLSFLNHLPCTGTLFSGMVLPWVGPLPLHLISAWSCSLFDVRDTPSPEDYCSVVISIRGEF